MNLEDMKERLRKSFEYSVEDYASRLIEVGGPGVGGTELAYRPKTTSPINTHDEYIKSALEFSIWKLWEETTWCYVDGRFYACIVMSAVVLEIALKYELFTRFEEKSLYTLGKVIKKAIELKIIPNNLVKLAYSINNRRNDIVHANVQINRPESLFHHTGTEHISERIYDYRKIFVIDPNKEIDESAMKDYMKKNKYYRVFEFKGAAKSSLDELLIILKYLYPKESTIQSKI
jgi:hypothetical protein